MHCHVEFHNSDGMAMVIKAGEDSDMVPPPSALPRCHNFFFNEVNQTEHCEHVCKCFKMFKILFSKFG